MASCVFSREDLAKEVMAQREQENFYSSNISVENYKGSEKVGLSEIPLTEEVKKNISNWKRSDLVEKRVIRGLSEVSKDFFNNIASSSKATTNENKLKIWEDFLKVCFPNLYRTARLKILGQI